MIFQLNCFGMFRPMVALVSGQTPGNGPNKNLGNAARSLLPCVLTIAFCLLPNAANAEGRCPPGMFETGSRDYLACAPIPGYGQQGDEGSEPEQEVRPVLAPMVSSYMAAAHHIDTSAVWITNAHWSAKAANKRVMDACAAAMGNGCVLGATIYDVGHVAVVRDAMGLTWVKGAEINMKLPWNQQDNTVAPKQALLDCLKSSFGCELTDKRGGGILRSSHDPNADHSKDFFPENAVKRHNWIMVARPTKAAPVAWQGKSWLNGGKQDSVAARKALLDRCQQDSGVSCSITAYAANGVLVHFVNGKGQSGWTSAVTSSTIKGGNKKAPVTDRISVAARVERLCLPSVKPCRVIATYDAATPRMQIVEDLK